MTEGLTSAENQFLEKMAEYLKNRTGLVDEEARGMAREALQEIMAHTRECKLIAQQAQESRTRLEGAMKSMTAGLTKLEDLQNREAKKALLGIITILLTIVGFFLISYYNMHQ